MRSRSLSLSVLLSAWPVALASLTVLASLASCNPKLELADPVPPSPSGIPVGAMGAVGVHFAASAARPAAPAIMGEDDDKAAPPPAIPAPVPLPLPLDPPDLSAPIEPKDHKGPPPKKGMPL
jgi:hypothetical protein